MSAEPIDIEVRDKISDGVREKLLNIAQAALEGANSVERLQQQLKLIDGSNVNKLAQAQANLDRQTRQNNQSYLAQETALNRAIAAEDKAAVSAQKLQAAQAKTASAQLEQATATQRLATATAAAETAQARAATAAQRVASASTQAAAAVNAFGETEAQVSARLAGVAAAGAALARQQQNIATSATTATVAENRLAQATTNAGNSANQAAQRYSNYMSALNTIGKNPAPVANPGVVNQSTAAIAGNTAALNAHAGASNNAGTANLFNTRTLVGSYIQYQLLSAAIQLVTNSIKEYFAATNEYQNLQNKLLALTVSQAEVNRLTFELLDVANRSRAPLESVGTTYQRINQALKSVGGSSREALQITESLTKATAAAGLTTSEQASALLQVSQAFNKGKLDGDEFRSVMENFPTFGDAIAKSLGLANKGLLFEAARTGKINLDVMRDAMLKLGETADQQLARSTKTVDQSFTQFKNSTTVLIGELDKLTGVSSRVSNFFTNLSLDANAASKAFANYDGTFKGFVNTLALLNTTKEVNQLEALVAAGNSSLEVQNKLIDAKKRQNALELTFKKDSVQTVRGIDNAAALDAEAGRQGAFASSLSAVTAEMDKLKIGTHKADEEIKTYRLNLDKLGKSANDLGTPEALAAYQKAKSLQAQTEAEIRRKDSLSVRKTPAVSATLEENRESILAKINAQLDTQGKYYDEIKEKRTVLQKIDEIDDKLATHTKNGRLAPLKALSDAEKERLTDSLEKIEVNKRLEASEDAIYQNAIGPLQKYEDGTEALNILLSKTLLTTQQYTEAQAALEFAFNAATDPLFLFNKEMKQQNELLESNLDAKQRAAQAQVNSINNSLAPQGKKLTSGLPGEADNEAKRVLEQVAAQQKLNEVTQAYDAIVAANKGAYDQLNTQQLALNKALDAGVISEQQYARGLTDLAIAKANLKLDQGFGDFADVGLASFAKLIEGYKNGLAGLRDTFGSFFTSLTDGFANSIGRAIVYGENLGDALRDVARSALSELISSLVKLGIQFVVNAALGQATQKAALAASTAASVAAASTTAIAWAPAAAAVSLASFGANSVPATAGILETYALTEALGLLSLQSGGYTGSGGVSDIAGVVHGQEFVVNAAGTAANRSTLERMNRGESVGSNNITIEDHTSGGVQFTSAPGMTPGEVRLIATDVAKNVVASDAPGVISSHLNDQNSKVSKSFKNNFDVQPKR